MSGIVPARIAASFTMAELAVLTVIARQCQRAGVCVLPVDAIAALAGCCRTTVQNTLRQARLVGLLLVRERRIPGLPSLTNIVSIISKEWIAWLKLGGFKRLSPTSLFKEENASFVPQTTLRSSGQRRATTVRGCSAVRRALRRKGWSPVRHPRAAPAPARDKDRPPPAPPSAPPPDAQGPTACWRGC